MTLELTDLLAHTLWRAIRHRLNLELPLWEQKIQCLGQVAAVERREAGHRWSDDEVFEALLRAVLSNTTDWAKIEGILPELRVKFSDFSLDKYAEAADDDVIQQYLPWFQKHKAGSMTLAQSLVSLVKTAGMLRKWSTQHGSAEGLFSDPHQFVRLASEVRGSGAWTPR